MDGLLRGKTAIVTGGAGAIGAAVCEVFTAHGANLVVSDLPGAGVEDTVARIRGAGGNAVPYVADVGTIDGANGCVRAALAAYGRLNVLVANAGLFPGLKKPQELPLERVEQLLHTNIGGVYLPVRAALPALRRTRGAIVAAGSEAAVHGPVPGVSYGATKDWVSAFIRGIAVEQGPHGVRANVVAPGSMDGAVAAADAEAAAPAVPLEALPLGRRATPHDVANVFLFLASDLACYVTGSVYTVDGGATASESLGASPAKARSRR